VIAETEATNRWRLRLARYRVGQLLGLLFLAGPVADLVRSSAPSAALVVISLAGACFCALYLLLLPPIDAFERRGERAIHVGLALLAALAALTLVLGAPSSFVVLFVYVAVAAGLLLRPLDAAAVVALTAAAVGIGLAATGSGSSTVAAYALSVLGLGLTMAALGNSRRSNRELREAREELARLAVAEERLRIARDVHDLLGHTLSLVALKSELAAKLVRKDPLRAESEMNDVREVTRQALDEVRTAVQGYRQLALEDALDGARAALAAAGIECRVVDRSAATRPPELENVLAWALREATTNVVRHSGAHGCAITVADDADAISLEVEDDGMAVSGVSDEGVGLAGLAERARSLDGTLEAGPRPGGGFRLHLTLPFPSA
jgi:two-component system, NarL family, sensor histidine kinase DesK